MGSTDVRGRDRNPITSYNQAAGLKVLLCALAMGALLASFASAQVIDGFIQVPDTFGVIRGPYHFAWDSTPGEERFFVGGESADVVVVVDAITCQKLARIQTGPVGSLCYSSSHGKLYVMARSSYTLSVVDCSSYQVVGQLQFRDYIDWLLYNPIVDRVYCGSSTMKVIDCASDSVVRSVPGVGTGCMNFDLTHNKLYVGAALALKVVDCYSDSLVASVQRVRGARAFCSNPVSDRLYAVADDTLYAVDAETDSVVDQLQWCNTLRAVACDPVRNRIYGACDLAVNCLDCAADTFTWGVDFQHGTWDVACVPELDKVYVTTVFKVYSLDGATGQENRVVPSDGRAAPLVYLSRMSRLYCMANRGQVAAFDCSVDTAVGQVPVNAFTDASAERVCVDTVDNKLYFAYYEYCGYLGVVNCSAKLVESQKMCKYPEHIIHDALDDKLYVSTYDENGSGVSVFDCKNDSQLKFVPTGQVKGGLRWHSELNKVYAGKYDIFLGQDYVTVIDCAADSVTRTIARGNRGDPLLNSLLSIESNQFWGISAHGYTVVDCGGDSVVMDTVVDLWNPKGVCYSEASRKVYVIRGSLPRELVVLSMESLRPVKSVPLCLGEPEVVLNVPAAGKLYVAAITEMSTTDSVYVVDTGTDSIVSRFDAGHIIRAMCDDATGRYVYCTALIQDSSSTARETLLVIDTRCDSIVSGASLPGVTWGGGEWLLPNRRTGMMYAGQDPNGKLLVIRDSVVVGVEESDHAVIGPALQTVVNRAVPLRSIARADLYDASGRRVIALRSGLNDISQLVPGVYFVCEEPQTAGPNPRAVRKMVVAK